MKWKERNDVNENEIGVRLFKRVDKQFPVMYPSLTYHELSQTCTVKHGYSEAPEPIFWFIRFKRYSLYP